MARSTSDPIPVNLVSNTGDRKTVTTYINVLSAAGGSDMTSDDFDIQLYWSRYKCF